MSKVFKLPSAGSQARVKVVGLFAQPQKYEGVDGNSVPPLPSMNADTYYGSDMGIDLNRFLYNVQSITFNPVLSSAWGSDGWDGTFQPDLAVMTTPEYAYNPTMPLNYNRGSDPNYWVHAGGQNQFQVGALGLGYQTNWVMQPYDHAQGGGIQPHPASPADWIGTSMGGGGLMAPDWQVQQSQGVGIFGNAVYGPKDTYEYWRGGQIPSDIPAHNDGWTTADNGDTKSYPETTADLQNYSKSLSKFLICELDGQDLLNGYGECAKADAFGNCVEWAYFQSQIKRRFIVMKPKGLWSQEVGFGPDPDDESEVHVYEGEKGFIPIQPPYVQNDFITIEKLEKRYPLTTNPLVIQDLFNMGCHDDVVEMNYIDSQGNQQMFQVAYASWTDSNSEARKRSSGLGGDFEEECIILCDSEGNEREGVILFREEDCSDELSVTPTTPTTGGGGGAGGDVWICIPAWNPTTGQQQQPGCERVSIAEGQAGGVGWPSEQECINNCDDGSGWGWPGGGGGGGGDGGGGGGANNDYHDCTAYGCVPTMGGGQSPDSFTSFEECFQNCDPCDCAYGGWAGLTDANGNWFTSEGDCKTTYCTLYGRCCEYGGMMEF